MKKRIFLIILALSLVISLLASCNNGQVTPKSRVYYDYFDTVCTVYDYTGGSEEDFFEVLDFIKLRLSEYHKLYDIYNEYEDTVSLCEVNRRAKSEPVKVDKKTIDLLIFAKEIYSLTGGECNVAFGSVLSIWHNYRSEGKRIPPIDTLESGAAHTDISDLIIDEENMTVFFSDPDLSLDVGAVAKGYCEEMIALELENEGISGYVLDFGGNLRTIGEKVDGSGWSTGIKNPDVTSPNRYVHTLTLKNESLSTSGDYERFYTVDGVKYHHIIDKDTLMPSRRFRSVSVKSPSAALSDSLSTAFFNMDISEIETLVSSREDIYVVIVLPDGEVKIIE